MNWLDPHQGYVSNLNALLETKIHILSNEKKINLCAKTTWLESKDFLMKQGIMIKRYVILNEHYSNQ